MVLIPGKKSRQSISALRRLECPQITYSDADFPIFVRRAKGTRVWDVDGNEYLDLTSFFGVSSLGHAAPVVRRAAEKVLKSGWHAMGDVHPHALKLEAARAITSVLPSSLSQVFFSSNGSDAVETALKTAFLHTRRPGVIAFEGAYHGLGYGAMQVTHRAYFREPFVRQAKPFAKFAPFVSEGDSRMAREQALGRFKKLLKDRVFRAGAVILEPVQGRAGVRPMDAELMGEVVRLSRRAGLVVIFDEIFTGFGRTGSWFAFERYGVIPDLLCLGKGMSNGFPISACVGNPQIFKAWGPSRGEAKHTSTFLGHPLGCAMTVATIGELKKNNGVQASQAKGDFLCEELTRWVSLFPKILKETRGAGLMRGLVFREPKAAAKAAKALLKKGVILLPSGENADVLSFTPPFTISKNDLNQALCMVLKVLHAHSNNTPEPSS